MKNKDLIVKFRNDCLFELTQDFNFYFDENTLNELKEVLEYKQNDEFGEYITVKHGFATDFGSIPSIFQGIVSPIGLPTKAYVVHDLFCVLAHENKVKRKTADDLFVVALKKLKVNKFKIYLLYACVRSYGALCVEFPQWVKSLFKKK